MTCSNVNTPVVCRDIKCQHFILATGQHNHPLQIFVSLVSIVSLVGVTGVCTFKQVLGRLGAGGALRNRAGGSLWTSANCLGRGQLSSSSSSSPSLLWPIKWISAKEHFISICPQQQNMVINSSFQRSGKQIGTLTGVWLKEALLPIPSGLARGSASVPIQRQSLCFIIQHDSMGLERRTQMGATDARCQPLALSLRLSSLYMHKYIRTPSNIDSLCSLWQAQAVCFCGLMSPLYLSVITLELSDPKTKREPWCVPALLAEGPCLLPLVSFSTSSFIYTHSLYRSISI